MVAEGPQDSHNIIGAPGLFKLCFFARVKGQCEHEKILMHLLDYKEPTLLDLAIKQTHSYAVQLCSIECRMYMSVYFVVLFFIFCICK